jgi:aromatic-L-amino-acid decarboxylase
MTELSTQRSVPIDMDPEQFRALGHALIDALADFREGLPERPVSPGKAPADVRAAIEGRSLPEEGADAAALLAEVLPLLADNQSFNGHPRWWGYITSSPAPMGVLADLITAALNPNLGLWQASPIATEIELQTAAWIADLLGFPGQSGVMTSGGQWANHIGVLLARRARAPWDVRASGAVDDSARRMRVYASVETHGWLKQSADIFGLGTDSIRWIPTDPDLAMDLDALREAIHADQARGDIPMMVVGAAGTVGTGAIDPLPEIARICREHEIWFHVDGAYGACAAALPDASPRLLGLREADSVAVDPHKWLYAPIDVGCTLVRDPAALRATFGARASYYVVDDDPDAPVNLYEYAPENSRRFRALKVWLTLRQIGAEGHRRLIAEDIALARRLFELVAAHPDLQAVSNGLSITTFRYIPSDLQTDPLDYGEYLNRLNKEVLQRIQRGGEAFISNTTVRGAFVLRACIVNFRTTITDIEALPTLVSRIGAETDRELRVEGRG